VNTLAQIALLLGAILFAALFFLDHPDQQKIATLQKDLDDWVAIRDRASTLASSMDAIAPDVPAGHERAQMYLDAAKMSSSAADSAHRVVEIETELHAARSTGRATWAGGVVGCLFFFAVFRHAAHRTI
jgi:hypothetical protein